MSDFQLVTPDSVANRQAKPTGAERWTLLEAHFTSADHPPTDDPSHALHIPGAIQVHPSYLEAGLNRAKYYPLYGCPADGNLLPDDELRSAIRRLGITPDTTVVVYGRDPDGTMAAARLVWGLLYAGVQRVRLLDGGLAGWLDFGGETVPNIVEADDVARGTADVVDELDAWPTRPDILATTEEVRAVTRSSGSVRSKLVDVRDAGEWDGTITDHYSFFSSAGHIPTAIHQGEWDNLCDRATHSLAPRLDAVARRWRAQGILDADVQSGDTTLIFYCGTGWRSSIAFLVAQLLGLRAKNYDGGFYGWSRADAMAPLANPQQPQLMAMARNRVG